VAEGKKEVPWQFLSDNAVQTGDQDKFGVHSAFAGVIYHIAKTCDTPFSIGLYSSWGTGKTSVCNLINQLSSGDEKVHYVYLDVWKYSNEPLKRWILLETHRTLVEQAAIVDYKFKDRSLESHLEFEETWEDRDRVSVNYKAVRLLGVGVVVACCTFFALLFLPHPSFTGRVLTLVTAFLAAGGLAAFLLEAVIKELFKSLSGLVFDRKVRHVTAAAAFSAEKFGEIFRDIIRAATASQGREGSRIIFVFDNLDRCSEEVAVETIGVIKTYLDEPGCVYITPCDEAALMRHITKSYTAKKDGDDQKYAKEFLNKFFQTTLRLPIAPEFDIETFLDEQLQLASMNDLPADARDVLVLGYLGQTPRQIKRVLNDLIAYRSLAVQAETQGLVEIGALTSDLSLLTKMSVISVEWPSFLNSLSDDPEMWIDITNKISAGRRGEITDIAKDLTSFLHATRHVSTDADVRPFLYLKRVTYERNVAVATAVQNNLRKGESKEFLELLASAGTTLEQGEIIRIATDLARRWLEAQPPRDVFLKNSISVLLKAADKVTGNRMLELTVTELLEHISTTSKAVELAEILSLPDLFGFSPTINAIPKDKCIEQVASLFDPVIPIGKNHTQYWTQFLDNEGQLPSTLESLLSGYTEARYTLNESEALQLLYEASKRRKSPTDSNIDWLVSESILELVASKLTFLGDETDTQRAAVLTKFRSQIKAQAQATVTEEIAKTLAGTRTRNWDIQSKNAIVLLYQLGTSVFEQEQLNTIALQLIEQTTAQVSYPLKAPWLDALIVIRQPLPVVTQTSIDALYRPYLIDPADPAALIQLLTAMNRSTCALLLAQPENVQAMHEQSQRLELRLTIAQAPAFREQVLNCFPAINLIEDLSIFDETKSWDLSLFPKIISRGKTEKVAGEVLRERTVAFIERFIKGSSSKLPGLLDELLTVTKEASEFLDEAVARALSECCIELLGINVEKYFSDLRFLRTKLSESNRIWLTRELVSKFLKPSEPQWIQVLQKLSEDIAADASLSKDDNLANDLMDYAFEAARVSPSEATGILVGLIPQIGADRSEGYLDQAQDRLIALESSGTPISQMAPYLSLLKKASSNLNGELPTKLITFCNRMLGLPKPEDERNAILSFLRDMALPLSDRSLAERVIELLPEDDPLAEAARRMTTMTEAKEPDTIEFTNLEPPEDPEKIASQIHRRSDS
jgi:KAP family P-loop domain